MDYIEYDEEESLIVTTPDRNAERGKRWKATGKTFSNYESFHQTEEKQSIWNIYSHAKNKVGTESSEDSNKYKWYICVCKAHTNCSAQVCQRTIFILY